MGLPASSSTASLSVALPAGRTNASTAITANDIRTDGGAFNMAAGSVSFLAWQPRPATARQWQGGELRVELSSNRARKPAQVAAG